MAKEHVEYIFANKELSSTDKIAYIYWLNQMCTEVFDMISEVI